jgi:hypothetical protein
VRIELTAYALPRRAPRRRLLLNSFGCSSPRFGQRLRVRRNRWSTVDKSRETVRRVEPGRQRPSSRRGVISIKGQSDLHTGRSIRVYPVYRISRPSDRGAGTGTSGHRVFRIIAVRAPALGLRWDSIEVAAGACTAGNTLHVTRTSPVPAPAPAPAVGTSVSSSLRSRPKTSVRPMSLYVYPLPCNPEAFEGCGQLVVYPWPSWPTRPCEVSVQKTSRRFRNP